MKLKQISVPIENSHDRPYEITKALAQKRIHALDYLTFDMLEDAA